MWQFSKTADWICFSQQGSAFFSEESAFKGACEPPTGESDLLKRREIFKRDTFSTHRAWESSKIFLRNTSCRRTVDLRWVTQQSDFSNALPNTRGTILRKLFFRRSFFKSCVWKKYFQAEWKRSRVKTARSGIWIKGCIKENLEWIWSVSQKQERELFWSVSSRKMAVKKGKAARPQKCEASKYSHCRKAGGSDGSNGTSEFGVCGLTFRRLI